MTKHKTITAKFIKEFSKRIPPEEMFHHIYMKGRSDERTEIFERMNKMGLKSAVQLYRSKLKEDEFGEITWEKQALKDKQR